MISKIIREDLVQQTKKLIDRSNKIIIVSHTSPDGDAVGSSLGLFHFLGEMGKDVSVILPDAPPASLKCLSGFRYILDYSKDTEAANLIIPSADLIFCVDFNAINRLAGLESAIASSLAKKVMIDHHLSPESFCNITISYPEISSTGELIFRLICRMERFDLLNKESAESIYVAMMTDTGNFTYNSNKPEIYSIIYELIKKGINKDDLYTKIMNTNSLDKIRLNSYAMCSKLSMYLSDKAAAITLSREELNRFHYQKGDTEGLVNVPLGVEGVQVSALFKEEDNLVKVSLRSRGKFPVNRIASEYYNGGGHLNAAGGEFYGTIEEALQRYENLLPLFEQFLDQN